MWRHLQLWSSSAPRSGVCCNFEPRNISSPETQITHLTEFNPPDQDTWKLVGQVQAAPIAEPPVRDSEPFGAGLQVHKFSSTQFTLLGSFDEDMADRGCKGEVVSDVLFVCQETGESEEAKEKVPDFKDAKPSRAFRNRLELKGRLCSLPGVSWFDLYWKSTSVPALEVLLGSGWGVGKAWWRDMQGSSSGLSRFNRFKKRQEVPCFRHSPSLTRSSFVNFWLCFNEGLPQSLSASEEAARGAPVPVQARFCFDCLSLR